MKVQHLLISGLMTLSGATWGQTACPGGVPPGDPRCGPSPSGHGFPSAIPNTTPSKQLQAKKRKFSSWAAIAYNPSTKALGMSGLGNDVTNRKEAEQTALQTCRANGGEDGCKILTVYKNECAALAIGMNQAGNGVLYADKGASEDKASTRAMKECRQNSARCQTIHRHCVTGSFYFDGWELR